ncbi:MAG: hypothetical protein ACHQC8_01935 [Solirubrobacterales bacterium]
MLGQLSPASDWPKIRAYWDDLAVRKARHVSLGIFRSAEDAPVLLTVLVTSAWAAFDAGTNEGIGTGIVVLVGCLALWVLVFPLYLVKRSQRERERSQEGD